MKERMAYKQLRPEERVVISSMRLLGESTRAMARVLSRPASTISRELRPSAASFDATAVRRWATPPTRRAPCTRVAAVPPSST